MMRFTKDNLKGFVQKGKVALGASAVAVSTALMSVPAFASGEDVTVDVTSSLQTGLNQVSVDFLKYVALVVPIALGIFAAPFAIKKGVQFFKSLASKG